MGEPESYVLQTLSLSVCLSLMLFLLTLMQIRFFFFFFWGVLRPFQEYFTYIEPIVHQRWAKTGEPREKPPDHP